MQTQIGDLSEKLHSFQKILDSIQKEAEKTTETNAKAAAETKKLAQVQVSVNEQAQNLKR